MKIPDQYLTGSKPLNDKKEIVIKSFITVSTEVADAVINNKNIIESTFKLKNLSNLEKNRISFEIMLFSLFVISQSVINNYKGDNYKEILDRMFFHFRKAIYKDDFPPPNLDFVEIRYGTYIKASMNNTGAGRLYWLGKEVTINVLNQEEKDIDPEVKITGPFYFAELLVDIGKSVKKTVELLNE